jgi:hypothetical protein
MKLWVIRSKQFLGYDTYDSAVVAAETEEDARNTSPSGSFYWRGEWWYRDSAGDQHTWPESGWVYPDQVVVEYLGETDRDIHGVVLSSFNAG